MIAYLATNGDWLLAAVFLSVVVSTVIGLKDGAKGGAVLLSNASAAVVAIAFYPFLEKWGYGGPFIGVFALFCGSCGYATLGVLTSLSDMITRRREKLAGDLLDRIVPPNGDKDGP